MSAQKEQPQKQQITYFEKQRDALISEIAISMDSVLNNINALNRSLEGSIAMGKEFDSVSSLWSNFYDGLAQVEQLRAQQHVENEEEVSSGAKEQEEQQGEEATGEKIGSDVAPEDDRMEIEQHEQSNEDVDLHEDSNKN